MKFNTKIIQRDRYEYAGSNQHGSRYKKGTVRSLRTCTLTSGFTASEVYDMRLLAILSDRLGVPLRFDFESQTASIEILATSSI